MHQFKSFALGVAAAAFLATAALAATPASEPAANTSALEAAFNNTIRITSKDGEELIYFNRDGTFTSTGPGPDQDAIGTWKVDGNKICTKTKDAAESCGMIEPGRSVGDKWQHKIGDDTVTVEIVKGR
ncbi:MAG: hypothetical protein WAW96_09330 [Alphaproteobacteria bacterium]